MTVQIWEIFLNYQGNFECWMLNRLAPVRLSPRIIHNSCETVVETF